MVAFGVVELERPGDAVEDGVGGAGEVAAFQADVVVDADAGEQRRPLRGAVLSPGGCRRSRAGRPAQE